MCGIVGFQGAFSEELLTAMTGAVAHRGPDGCGQVLLGEPGPDFTGLGHRRLSIIDLSESGSQPMTTRCARCGSSGVDDLALSFNGEIYNFMELRRELQARGHAMHSSSDSEVLLHLYADEGLRMVDRLNGIFAFAIRDARERGRPDGIDRGDVFVARDQIGVKPLYVAALPRGVLFASELKALLHSPEVSRDIDLVAVHQQLAYLWTPAPRTVLRGVRKLPPGSAFVLRAGRMLREWSYYDVPYGRPALAGTESQIAEELRERVSVAVERQLVADVPVGAFLSGGLDSSAVVAMMKRNRPADSPQCYSIGFADGRDADGSPADLPYAKKVASHLGVRLHTIEVGADMVNNLERMLFFLDEPQADPAPINALLICEQARRDGIKVLLSGAGGDDIFSGYRRHRALGAERFWSGLPRAMRRAMAAPARAAAGGGAGLDRPWLRRIVKAFEHADLPRHERMVSYFWWSGEHVRRPLYTAAVRDALANESTAAPLLESLRRIDHERDPLNRMLYLETKHFLADHNLNYTDKMGMAHGVEVRVPLLDLDLVAFAARIPSAFKQRGAVGKSIFKKAMEPLLPHDVIYRPKSGFGAPLRHWLRNELRDRLEDALSERSLTARGVFDPAAVQRLIKLDRAGRVDGAYTLFAIMCFELWCRIFVDAPVDAAPGFAHAPLAPSLRG